jgi:hypothetical protein
LRVKQIDETGVLADTYFSLVPSDVLAPDPAGPGRRFADLINTRLTSASDKDVFIQMALLSGRVEEAVVHRNLRLG